MVADRSVVVACSHTAILEICVQIRTGTGLSVLAFRTVLCQREPLGKPRLTLVSDGNPLRRLLLRSQNISVFTAVSPFGWICPSHPERGNCFYNLSVLGLAPTPEFGSAYFSSTQVSGALRPAPQADQRRPTIVSQRSPCSPRVPGPELRAPVAELMS
jgi:hypothetical protein